VNQNKSWVKQGPNLSIDHSFLDKPNYQQQKGSDMYQATLAVSLDRSLHEVVGILFYQNMNKSSRIQQQNNALQMIW